MNNRTFSDKVALVTGGTSGIGKATAIEFGGVGAKVVLSGRREKEGAQVVAEIKKLGGDDARRTPIYKSEESIMSVGAFARKKYIEIKGQKMAFIDEGEGDPIVFQHGNPTSSYLWRKVMPACKGLGRLIACDLIGMGDSDKLPQSGPDRYTFVEQRDFLFALWEELGIERDVILVIHDWGSALGFHWAQQHRDRVQGIAYMEAIVKPLAWEEFPEVARDVFKAFRTPAGEDMILRDNLFLEGLFFVSEKENLTEADKEEYRRPFLNAGEDRRPMLTWPRQIPLDGEPPEVVKIVGEYSEWLRTSDVPKLWIKGDPGAMVSGSVADYCATFPNQTSLTVKGVHALQESSGPEIGAAVANFVRRLRNTR